MNLSAQTLKQLPSKAFDALGAEVRVAWIGLIAMLYGLSIVSDYTSAANTLMALMWCIPIAGVLAYRFKQNVRAFWITGVLWGLFGAAPLLLGVLGEEHLLMFFLVFPLAWAMVPRSNPFVLFVIAGWCLLGLNTEALPWLVGAVDGLEFNARWFEASRVPDPLNQRVVVSLAIVLGVALHEKSKINLPWDKYRKFAAGFYIAALVLTLPHSIPLVGSAAFLVSVVAAAGGLLLTISVGNQRETPRELAYFVLLWVMTLPVYVRIFVVFKELMRGTPQW